MIKAFQTVRRADFGSPEAQAACKVSRDSYFRLACAMMFEVPQNKVDDFPILKKSISELTEEEAVEAYELWMDLHLGRR